MHAGNVEHDHTYFLLYTAGNASACMGLVYGSCLMPPMMIMNISCDSSHSTSAGVAFSSGQ